MKNLNIVVILCLIAFSQLFVGCESASGTSGNASEVSNEGQSISSESTQDEPVNLLNELTKYALMTSLEVLPARREGKTDIYSSVVTSFDLHIFNIFNENKLEVTPMLIYIDSNSKRRSLIIQSDIEHDPLNYNKLLMEIGNERISGVDCFLDEYTNYLYVFIEIGTDENSSTYFRGALKLKAELVRR